GAVGSGAFETPTIVRLGAASSGGSGLFRGFRSRGGLAAALGLRRGSGGFADQFSRHDAGHEELCAMIVAVHGGAFTIGGGDDAQSIYFMLDCLTFCHCLHDVLLDFDWMRKPYLMGASSRSRGSRIIG